MRRIGVVPVLLGLFWTLLLVALFSWNMAGERRHILELAEYQARAFYQQILATRSWNSAHGGVYAPVGPSLSPNPYLPESERILLTSSGVALARINPAYMTRQIADIAAQSAGIHFRITSLSPVRPENGPDVWERQALAALSNLDTRSIQAAGPDVFELVPGPDGLDQFRFMAPLQTEESCLACHAGEIVGAIRGGIGVSTPAGPLLASRAENQRVLATTYGIIWFVGLVGLGGSTFEINRRREKAEALNRMKSRFLANMSHDMRTPLTGIIGLSERLSRQAGHAGTGRYARLIAQSAGSLLELVTDILDFARTESGRLELRDEPFDPRRVVEETARLFAFAAEEKGLAFSARVDEAVPRRLLGDAFRYRQVLANLLGNAVKFTDHGAVRVEVEAAPRSDGKTLVRTTVSDSGVGIDPRDFDRIFDSFSQVDDSLSRRHAGSGLGLSIARRLARMMGGDILVQSRPGQGSAFVFTARLAVADDEADARAPAMDRAEADASIPGRTGVHAVAKTPSAPRDVAEAKPPFAGRPEDRPAPRQDALAGRRVLVVDDHAANRVLIKDILLENGAAPRLAASGPEALALFEDQPVDVVLLDLQMPGLDGLETARRLRAMETELARPRTPLFILTAFARAKDRAAIPADLVDGVVTKPIDAPALLRLLADVMDPDDTPGAAQGRADPAPAEPGGDPSAPGGLLPIAALPDDPPAAMALPGDPASAASDGPTPVVIACPPSPVSADPDGQGPPSAAPDPAEDVALPCRDEALRLLGGREDLYRLLAEEFLDGAPELAGALETAVRRGEPREIARLAHTLKSEAASLGARGLRLAAADLEARSLDAGGLDEEDLARLRHVLDRTSRAIRRVAAGS